MGEILMTNDETVATMTATRKTGLFFWPLVLLCIFASVALAFVCLEVSSEIGATFSSPTNPKNKILFLDGGFQERRLELCAISAKQKPVLVTRVNTGCSFAFGQWTRDGEAFVCSVSVESGTPVMAFAYEFRTGKVSKPPWVFNSGWSEKPEAEWRTLEPVIQQIAASHGGLNEERIDGKMIKAEQKRLRFWQIPNRSVEQ
jgi:hypothetical protein